MAYKEQVITKAYSVQKQEITKTFGVKITGNYQDLWRTNYRKLSRLMTYKLQEITKTYGVHTTGNYQDL